MDPCSLQSKIRIDFDNISHYIISFNNMCSSYICLSQYMFIILAFILITFKSMLSTKEITVSLMLSNTSYKWFNKIFLNFHIYIYGHSFFFVINIFLNVMCQIYVEHGQNYTSSSYWTIESVTWHTWIINIHRTILQIFTIHTWKRADNQASSIK